MKKLWDLGLSWWKKILAPIGIIQSRLLFLVLYLVVFLPTGIIMSIFSDPLRLKNKKPTWGRRINDYDSFESLKKQ